MTKHVVFSFSLLLIFLFRCYTCTAGAEAPDVTKILEKPGRFTILLRLLKSTGIVNQLNGELQKSNTGFTLFAPPDKAFSDLRSGSINSLSDLQKVQPGANAGRRHQSRCVPTKCHLLRRGREDLHRRCECHSGQSSVFG